MRRREARNRPSAGRALQRLAKTGVSWYALTDRHEYRETFMRSTTALSALFAVGAGAACAGGDPWALLGEIAIEEIATETTYEVRKSFPAALQGGLQEFRITGYAVPLTPGENVTGLLLVSDMGLCPFCGSGEHGGSLEVLLDEPMIGLEEGARISLVGNLEMVDDPMTWQTAVLRNARPVDG